MTKESAEQGKPLTTLFKAYGLENNQEIPDLSADVIALEAFSENCRKMSVSNMEVHHNAAVGITIGSVFYGCTVKGLKQ
ncbi:MAG: hypothetical protein H6774_00255 [Pseudomonadales bacterium]|nr:hypothetical protein [Pseudomonadales bacterium]